MSSPLTKHKKLILSLLLITLVIVGVFGAWHGVFAHIGPVPPAHEGPGPHETVTPPTTGNAILQQALGSQSWWFGLMLAIVVALQAIFAWLIIFSSMLLNVAFSMNLGIVPSALQVVQTGWVILRDLVNGIFILLVLWIALTIILGIEQYGGKKLLAKILAVAVLINFSLAIVTAIVVFSNQFALAFSRNMGGAEKDPAGFFITTLHINTTTNQLSEEKAKTLADKKKEYCKDVTAKGLTGLWYSISGVLELCHPNGAEQLVDAGLKVVAAAQTSNEWSSTQLNLVVQSAIGLIIIFVVTSAFLYGAIALLIRYFAILLLTIASPIAFITVALPMNLGKSEGWDYWWKEFMKWVFFAPAFYFLMYLAMLMATQYKNAFQAPNGLSAINVDGQYIFAMVIVLGLLIYASRFAKKTSGKIGEITVGLAKKAGGLALGVTAGVMTGGATMAFGAVARGAAKEGGIAERMAGNKFGRMIGGGALLRKGVQEREAQKQRIEERAKKYDPYSVSQMQAEVRGTGRINTEENAARIAALAKKKDGFKGFNKTEMRDAQNMLKHYHQAGDLTKVNPALADKDTIGAKGREAIANGAASAQTKDELKPIQLAAQGLTGTEIRDNLDLNSLKGADEKNKAVRDGILANSSFTHHQLEQMVQKDFAAAQEVVDAMGEFLDGVNGGTSGYSTQMQNLNNQIAAAGGNRQKVDALQTQKNNIEGQKRRLEGTKRYLTTAPGGQALGLAPQQGGWKLAPTPISYTGNRVINTQAGRSVAVDLAHSVAGGTGAHTFATTPGSGFIVGADGILKTDPTMSLLPGTHPITVTVTDAAGATTNINLTMNIT